MNYNLLLYEQAAEIHHWNIWTVDKKLCKGWFVIHEYIQCKTARSLGKVNFKI